MDIFGRFVLVLIGIQIEIIGMIGKIVKITDQETEKETKIIFKETSLGMSGDYIQALEAGATQIRIGTKLFGVRLC